MTTVFTIEVDLFSGRPNPVLELRGGDALHLQQLLARRRQAIARAGSPDQLGFRGFVIRGEGAGESHVRGEIVRIGGSTFRDPGREIHSFLVSKLPDELKAMLLPLLDPR